MSTKTTVWIGLFIGSSLGQYLASLFNFDFFSGWAFLISAVGGLLGVWVGYRVGQTYFP